MCVLELYYWLFVDALLKRLSQSATVWPCTHGQVFLDKFNLLVCTTKIDKLSWTSRLFQKLT